MQARITWRGSKLFKNFLQLIFIAAAIYTSLSRISDYKHHWSDVFGGLILGSVTAILLGYSSTDLFKYKNERALKHEENGSNHQV